MDGVQLSKGYLQSHYEETVYFLRIKRQEYPENAKKSHFVLKSGGKNP